MVVVCNYCGWVGYDDQLIDEDGNDNCCPECGDVDIDFINEVK